MDFPPPPPLIRVIRSDYWHYARILLSSHNQDTQVLAHTSGDWSYYLSSENIYNNPHSRYTRIYYYKDHIIYTEPDVPYSYYYEY